MPLGDYSSLLRCTYGTTGFQLSQYSFQETPIIGNLALGISGRRGSDILIRGKGWVEGSTTSEFNDRLWSIKHSLATSGKPFQIFGLATDPEVSIVPAECINLGPHITFTIEDAIEAAGPNMRFINFEVRAQTAFANTGNNGKSDGGSGDNTDTGVADAENFNLTWSARPDGLRTVTQTGEIRGGNIELRFRTGIFTGFLATYAPGRWSSTYQLEINSTRDHGKYTMTATEMADELPNDGFDTAVDGTGSYRNEFDEQQRLTETWEFDLIVRGSALLVWTAALASIPAGKNIIRQSVEIGKYKQHSLRGTVVALSSGSGSYLMNWTQSFKTSLGDYVTYEEKQYPGLPPLAVKRPAAFNKIVQTGSAIGDGVYPVPPDPLYLDFLLEQPEVVRTDMNAVEKRTDWTYIMAVDGKLPKQWPTRPDNPDNP